MVGLEINQVLEGAYSEIIWAYETPFELWIFFIEI